MFAHAFSSSLIASEIARRESAERRAAPAPCMRNEPTLGAAPLSRPFGASFVRRLFSSAQERVDQPLSA